MLRKKNPQKHTSASLALNDLLFVEMLVRSSCCVGAASQPLNKMIKPCKQLNISRQSRVILSAQKSKGAVKPKVAKQKSSKILKVDENNKQQNRGWDIYKVTDFELYQQGWDIPWGMTRTGVTMLVWVLTFVSTGFITIPIVEILLGYQPFTQIDAQSRAVVTLADQLFCTLVGLQVIRLSTKDTREEGGDDLFKFSLDNPFDRPNGWLSWGLIGIVVAPVIIAVLGEIYSLVGVQELSGRGTVDGIAQMVTLDGWTFSSLIMVTGILAPLLEETVFRGFLLTSLTKVMPTPQAVVASSVAFACAHLSTRDFPQLVCLGIVLGFVYVRSRNLLSPMLVHGVWNSTVLALLFVLVQNGINVNELLGLQQ
eukprot:TRINITY_DN20111_c0_g1_i1.p1 TRINITY_DN20111_c0_g1~~TRINITY_DN20111_c0_g1_i1.p1  ORF type:complete len:368 (+),score=44.86 TRINITY_DN20111_c0_g1_i1:71-1174(+)